MSVKNQEAKLNEAKYFISEMQYNHLVNNLEHFKYCLSAFSSAGRSILQYALDDAKSNGKQSVYDNLVKEKSAIKYFKDVRDANIHSRPASTIAHGNSDLSASITVPGDGVVESDDSKEAEVATLSTYSYHFEDEENVLEKSEAYLSELEVFIKDFKYAL